MTAPYTICPGCGVADPDIVLVDFGIGSYEFWGAPGYHTDEHLVTRCCEAQPEEFWPLPPEPGDVVHEYEMEVSNG